MSEAKRPTSASTRIITTTLLDSIIILFRNKRIFLSIFTFLTLPLSALHFCLTLLSLHLKDHVFHLEALANVVHTRFEARQIWQESREDAVSLLRLKSRFFIPSFILSCISCITATTSSSVSYHGQNPSLRTASASVKSSWMRVTVTSITIYTLLFLYSAIPLFLSAFFHSMPALRFPFMVLSLCVEVYMMAVTGLGLTASALEEQYGLDAVWVGSSLMKGRRVSGLALSGGFVFLSSLMGNAMEKRARAVQVAEAESWWGAMAAGGWDGAGLVLLYAAEVLIGYVVTTVFYCECKRRHENRDEDVVLVDL
ncbi:PREDICTED: uncharacterized protein LOC104811819 [Tarenaya hassleriana]|uniref:uncharacterized protein LOC104811819 n=1 Tax=Tarenaya hassleriana TaxID=28532 RepID=UPI00053C5696|nr:PREDICTED: uncharacterized protein LOC104811819 [Tarenaya hassleriana]XP_010536946.1 PREDICTED: uncharacterized protein LOC104811819 [Tarenaya hassleriana]XP_010536947.1 PREDICTED: uncharacterized protein LOC104811819 [Tarenaya hassleriana]